MNKRSVFELFALIFSLSLLVKLSNQACLENINDHLGKCKCESGTIVCMNQEKIPAKIDLKATFKGLATHLKDHNLQDTIFNELIIIESRDNYDESTFDDIKFSSIEIHETNLSSTNSALFKSMKDSLKNLYIQSDVLKDISKTIESLSNLERLYLVMGLKSIRELPENSVNQLNNLDTILLDGVISTIRTNAINSLPALKRIRITNQLETIESGSFNLTDANQKSIVIDLSNNRLNNVSFSEDFIVQNADKAVTLILTKNRLTSLPESIFMSFFNANINNKLVMSNNPFECGQCNSEWIVRKLKSERFIGLTCANSPQINPWKYVWNCKHQSSSSSTVALFMINSKVFLTFLFIISAFISV